MNFAELVRLGFDLIKYGTAIFEAARDNDRERLDALLTKDFRVELILKVGEAKARDIALRKKREAEERATGES